MAKVNRSPARNAGIPEWVGGHLYPRILLSLANRRPVLDIPRYCYCTYRYLLSILDIKWNIRVQ